MHATTGPEDASVSQDNELLTEILARRRRRLPAVTIALGSLLALALAFVVGAEVQKHYGTAATASSSSPAATFARNAAARGLPAFRGAGRAGAFGGANGGTSGTVTLIKGSSLYVTDSSGNTVIVKTSASSRVTKNVTSSVKGIRPGAVVNVVGKKGKDGSYTATAISVSNGANGG
jgi:hypothetical protein